MKIVKTQGLVAAPPTGFTEDGALDMAVVAPLATHLERQGLVGVFVNGTTGEGSSLTVEERETLAAEWRRTLPPRLRLFIHVGHNCIEDACRLARHAQAIKADATACIAPFFFKPEGMDQLVAWCAAVAGAAPGVPFYYYHMPAKSGVTPKIAQFIEAAAQCIPNFAGVKFTFEALDDFLESLRLAGGRYDLLWGRDEMLLSALAVGAGGGVGSTYNIAAPLYLRIIESFEAGDFAQAREWQARAVELIQTMKQSGNFFSVIKAILRAQGVPITPVVRPPQVSLSQAEAAGQRCLEIIEK